MHDRSQLKDLGLELDLRLAKDRVQLIFISIHLYFFLLRISQALPPLRGLLPPKPVDTTTVC